MKKKYVLFALIVSFSFPFNLYADPNISNVTYDLGQSSAVVITGNGFGTKLQAQPIQWDDFESGSNGSVVTTPQIGNTWGNSGGTTYTNSIQRGVGNFVSLHDFTYSNNYNQALVRRGGPWSQLYISFYYRSDYGDLDAYLGDPCRNYKVVRFEGDSGTKSGYQGIGVPIVAYEKRASSSSSGLFETALRADYNVSEGSGTFYGGVHERKPIQWAHREWHRVEFFMSVAEGDKEFLMWEDAVSNNPSKSSTAWTRTYNPLMGSDGSAFNELTFGTYFSRDNGASAYVYMDDIYIDTTQARVELGDAPTWGDCTHREIQVPLSWSDNSISLTFNQGAFSAGQTVYLYVVDSYGATNSSGYPITVGGEGARMVQPSPELRIEN